MSDSKEEIRLKLKQEANFQRNLRYKDHRLRTIGIDSQALAKQIAEKKKLNDDEKELERLEKLRNDEIENILDSIEQEEKKLRAAQAAELKRQWDEQANNKKNERTQGRLKEIEDFNDGPSMTFAGEDKLSSQRKKAQQDQMKQWTQEAIELKAYNEAKAREEDMARAELNRALDNYRANQEQDEANMRRELTRRILEENKKMASDRARARLEERNENLRDLNNSIVLNADTEIDESGYCRSKDEFRGYSKGQMKQLLLENEELIRQKREAKEREKQLDADWYRESLYLQRVMAQTELDEQNLRKKLLQDQLDTLQQQCKEENDRKTQRKIDQFGTITGDFYAKFGTSCR
eukprot:CAMPEP_0174819576 /NCGR_PEP_ID=MMETSP1107-20130205/2895_1 /TAXON_ID=36770 /ORGANISM="Paraphysomonas vestita, Strain GFlagA" /LENGTH=349 /DNA_ID=CAMNT_0016033337 /DNA_START=79 /DNA_END=1128 /DNA_ORIENTATION=-